MDESARALSSNLTWGMKSIDIDYFTKQLKNPYLSTIAFFDFLESNTLITSSSLLIDACCGSLCNTIYATKRYGLKKILAFDFNEEVMKIGRSFLNGADLDGAIETYSEDIFNLSPKMVDCSVDGIIFLQTLSWLENWEKCLDSLSQIKAKWICVSSLFYPGNIESLSIINTYDNNDKCINSSPYNILSMPRIEKQLQKGGFKEFAWKKFNIADPVKQKDINKMGTYTKELRDGSLIQISGPILMNWHFLFASR
jgi:hypothetical protein